MRCEDARGRLTPNSSLEDASHEPVPYPLEDTPLPILLTSLFSLCYVIHGRIHNIRKGLLASIRKDGLRSGFRSFPGSGGRAVTIVRHLG